MATTNKAKARAALPVAEDPKPKPAKKEEQVSVTVHTPFRLQDDDSIFHEYGLGTQDIPRSHADHWFAKVHLDRNED